MGAFINRYHIRMCTIVKRHQEINGRKPVLVNLFQHRNILVKPVIEDNDQAHFVHKGPKV